MSRHLTTVRNAALVAVAVASLAACGSADNVGNTASNAASNAASGASAAASNASTAASEAGAAASSAASAASSNASTGASAEASEASSNASTAAAGASTAATNAASAAAGAYTLDQVATHKTASDCWVAIKAPGQSTTGVYDLTKWIAKHPGGAQPIEGLCGTNGTQAFLGKHGEDGPSGEPEKALAGFKIGDLKG